MRTVLVFILLKIVEILGIFFIPYFIGVWNPLDLVERHPWFVGCVYISFTFMILVVTLISCILAYIFFVENWKLAKDISRKYL